MARTGLSVEVRKVLAGATEPMRLAAIYEQCESAESTASVAGALRDEVQHGRAVRTGEEKSYTYAITPLGLAALSPGAAKRIERENDLDEGRPAPPRALSKAKSQAALDATVGAKPAKPDTAKTTLRDIVAKRKSVAPAIAPIEVSPPPTQPVRRGIDRSNAVSSDRLSDTIIALVDVVGPALQKRPVRESGLRLAAAVVVYWPSALTSMPIELRKLLTDNLARLQAT